MDAVMLTIFAEATLMQLSGMIGLIVFFKTEMAIAD